MSTPIQSARPAYLAIHQSTVFPARSVLCGSGASSTPATSVWTYVTCRACLVDGAMTDQAARATLERFDAEREARRREDQAGADPSFDLRAAARLDDPAFAAHLEALREGRLRAGREIRARMAAWARGATA